MPPRKIRNTLALALLGLLLERPMHPYEMASTLRERYKGSTFKINPGSLYDTVEALAKHRWIEPVETVRDGNRPERTVYAHTELGRQEFVAWLDELVREPVEEYPKFVAAVSYLGAPPTRWRNVPATSPNASRARRRRWPKPSARARRGCS
ncbi:PadR family transcriptional regulator [Amycolatopsis kentuckyensis]|uniref:PadR family transcriptional regulator n=1 Tax=Amycolatopsis kentuckyensis TaxID=218823 RepID=UPI001FC9FB4A|nr:PadR family transcriptional regulator [Amycolatopsis kentuckyensis]